MHYHVIGSSLAMMLLMKTASNNQPMANNSTAIGSNK